MRTIKFGIVVMAAAVMLMAGSPVYAQTGSVRITVTKVGFIVGVGGGTGALTYKGRRYPLRVGGISAGTIGVARAELVGKASNLRNPEEDIVGTYTAVSAGVAIAGGRKVAHLQNSSGVILVARVIQIGGRAS
jgi:hypothetical protein